MPYVKDAIGSSPRYVHKMTQRWYDRDTCSYVANKLKRLGIQYQKKPFAGTCAIYFQDSYEAYVDELKQSHFNLPFLN